MAEYHFVSSWQVQAPIERVWEEIYHAERWPSWWKDVAGVGVLEPGAADGVGRRVRVLFRTRLPYTLGFDARLTRVRPPRSWSPRPPGSWRAPAAGRSAQPVAARWSATPGTSVPPGARTGPDNRAQARRYACSRCSLSSGGTRQDQVIRLCSRLGRIRSGVNSPGVKRAGEVVQFSRLPGWMPGAVRGPGGGGR